MSVWVWIGVGILGSLGALARLLLESLISSRVLMAFPLGTVAVNVTGAFILGLLVGEALSGDAMVLAGSGAIGSYTTFSTWMLETHNLKDRGLHTTAALNVVVSVVFGLGAVTLGRLLAGWV
jgi:fluoride exporter